MQRTDHNETVSLWTAGDELPRYPRLDADLHAPVCVVGAGMAGLSVAYEVLRSGRSVVVLDRGAVGAGETSRSTAQLGTALDERYFDLARIHGADGARLAAESHGAAIDRVEQVVREEKIECGFERLDGYLFTGPDQSEDLLERELAAAHHAGLTDVTLVTSTPPMSPGRSLRFPRQAQMDPVRYIAGLAHAVVRAGGRIFSDTQAEKIEGGKPGMIVTAGGPVVTADQIVVATNTPVNNLFALHTKQAAYRTYVLAASVPRGSIARALYWDTLDPYHYVRIAASDDQVDWLIVGGEDHKTGQEHDPAERWTRLEEWMRARFPMVGAVGSRWSGQVMQSMDGLAYIGKNPLDDDNVFVVTGDTGTGITHGAIAGMLLADLLDRKENRWAHLYDPSRVSLRAGGNFLRENVSAVAPYADWLEAGDVNHEKEIAAGHGAVVRHGLKLLAVYRDDAGELHRCGAACPHLGGVVRWNAAERSWDCPCHGSRFDALGKVMNGPANTDLTVIEDDADSEVPALSMAVNGEGG